MKFSIERDELLKAISSVQGVVEKRNTMPILSNILLEAQENQLAFSATDLEVGITGTFPAKIDQPGRITLNAKNVMDITKQLPSQSVLFKLLDNQQVEISCGKILFKLHGLPAEDFPALPEFSSEVKFSFPSKDLASMIDHTIFSVSLDETRYNLSGVYLEQLSDSSLRMVSSDGHRLSLIDKEFSGGGVQLGDNVIIPRKGLVEIRKMCGEGDETIEMAFSKSNCSIVHDGSKLVIRLIDGEFPDYKQVLPEDGNQKKVVLSREKFLSSLRRISILSQEKTRGVRFQFDKNALKITVNNPDLGEAEEELEIQYAEPNLEIGFNAKYFMDVLSIIQTDEVELYLVDSMSQGLIRPSGGDENFKAVVMPMKLL